MHYFWNLLSSDGAFEFLMLLALAAMKTTFLLAFVALLCAIFRRFSAAARHLLWTVGLCAALLLPFLSLVKIWEIPILPASAANFTPSGSIELTGNDQIPIKNQPRATRNLSGSIVEDDNLPEKSGFQKNTEFPESLSLIPNAFDLQEQPLKNETSVLPQLMNWILLVWFAGVLLLLFRLLIGLVATHSLTRNAEKFSEPALTELFSSLLSEFNLSRKVRLLRSDQTQMPIVCGIFRPAVLLPGDAENWSEERRRLVLLHELAHVARRDCLTQMLAQTACVFYWFNPFVWVAARRLRVEREQACDDYVLRIGAKPSDYAQHLLEIARLMQDRSIFNWSQTTSVAMARRSQLEGRLLSILSKENKSGGIIPRAATAALVALIGCLFVSLAVIRPAVINAQKFQDSKTAAGNEKGKTETSLLDSFLAFGSEREDSTKKTDEVVKALEIGDAARDDSPEQAFTDKHIEKEGEPISNPNIDTDLEQSISKAVERQINATLQTPETIPPPNSELNPFINAEYEPERKRQTREKSEDFIEEMASVGYTNLTIEELVKLKQGDITADYVRGLQALGLTNLSVRELASMGIHEVTPAYIQGIRAAGYNNLSAKELTNLRIHDVTPGYIKSLRDAGFGNLNAKQLAEFAVHEVTPAFISGIRAAGFTSVSAKELVSLRVHEVTPEFIRSARSRFGELNVKQIISLKNTSDIEDDKDKD